MFASFLKRMSRKRLTSAARKSAPVRLSVEQLDERVLLSGQGAAFNAMASAVDLTDGHTAYFALKRNGDVTEFDFNKSGQFTGSRFVDSNVDEMSAGHDAQGHPVFYEIWGPNRDLWSQDTIDQQWNDLHTANVTHVAGSNVDDRFWFIWNGNYLFQHDGITYTGVGARMIDTNVLQISAGTDSAGQDVVYDLNKDHTLYRWSSTNGWSNGGQSLDWNVTSVAGGAHDTWFEISGGQVWENTRPDNPSSGWNLIDSGSSGPAISLSVGFDKAGNSTCYEMRWHQIGRYSWYDLYGQGQHGQMTWLDSSVSNVVGGGNGGWMEVSGGDLWANNNGQWGNSFGGGY
jgi:hypothetical protein